ncbi:MAG: hypothetical protein L0332_34475 [Chloroflexi bacterium]|nr:hypothetical protein [Chloroflexota bacterium]
MTAVQQVEKILAEMPGEAGRRPVLAVAHNLETNLATALDLVASLTATLNALRSTCEAQRVANEQLESDLRDASDLIAELSDAIAVYQQKKGRP